MVSLKKVSGVLAGAFVVGGFFFLDRGMTGNVIVENSSSFDPVSVVGLLLVACAVFLAAYAIRK